MYNYLKDSITQYTKSAGKSGTCSLQALPRLLTLWLTFTALTDKGDKHALKRSTSTGGRAASNLGNALLHLAFFHSYFLFLLAQLSLFVRLFVLFIPYSLHFYFPFPFPFPFLSSITHCSPPPSLLQFNYSSCFRITLLTHLNSL